MSKDEVEQELFILDMKDHFTHEDFERKEELLKLLRELNNEQD